MSVNLYKPHVAVLPEDDANRQMANGFLQQSSLNLRQIQVLPIAGGWAKVRDDLADSYLRQLAKYPQRHLVLLIDFDHKFEERFQIFQDVMVNSLQQVRDRVYLLGTQDEPEPLRKALGQSLEQMGKHLAYDCANNTRSYWNHPMLVHNQQELNRLHLQVKPFLFKS